MSCVAFCLTIQARKEHNAIGSRGSWRHRDGKPERLCQVGATTGRSLPTPLYEAGLRRRSPFTCMKAQHECLSSSCREAASLLSPFSMHCMVEGNCCVTRTASACSTMFCSSDARGMLIATASVVFTSRERFDCQNEGGVFEFGDGSGLISDEQLSMDLTFYPFLLHETAG